MGEENKKNFWSIGKQAFKNWINTDATTLAASVAYYAIFALPAILLIVINIAGSLFGQAAVKGEISSQLSSILGADTAQQLQTLIENASVNSSSPIMTIIGIVVLVVSATGLFIHLQKALNRIWEVKTKPETGIVKKLLNRTASFGVIILIGLLLLASILLTTALSVFSDFIIKNLPSYAIYLFYAISFLVSFGLIIVLFALIYKILPDVKIKWRSVWRGAIFTAFLFMLGKFAMSYYFGHFNPGSAYGAAGTIILTLLWIYYSCLLLFYGAAFTQVYAKEHNHPIKPNSYSLKTEPCPS